MISTARLGDFVRVRTGKLDANANDPNGAYPFFTCAETPLRINRFSYDCECVLVAGNGDLNVKHYAGKFDAYQQTYIIESENRDNLHVRYLFHFMSRYVEQLRAMSIGGVIKYIKLDYLTEAQIPLPPLTEQRRIASILDQAEALRAKRRHALAKLDTLTQSFFLDLFGDPATNAKGWSIAFLDDLLAMPLRNGLSPSNSGGVKAKVLTLSAITGDAFRADVWKEAPFQSVPPSDQRVDAADLLICRGNGNIRLVGKGYFPPCDMPDLTFPDTMIAARIAGDRVAPDFLQVLWNGSFALIVPPLPLQREFVAQVSAVERLKTAQRASLAKLDALFASLQYRAFRGEL